MPAVLIVDGNPLTCEGLRHILTRAADVSVVGATSDGQAAVAEAMAVNIDVVLLGSNLTNPDSVVTCVRLRKTAPDAAVIVMVTQGRDENILIPMLRTGIMGVTWAHSEPESVIDIVRGAARGETYIHPEFTTSVLSGFATMAKRSNSRRPFALTEREHEVVELLTAGLDNREIAARLFISEKTVRNHLTSVYRKMSVRGRTPAAVKAVQNHLSGQ